MPDMVKLPAEYGTLLADIKERVRAAQLEALREAKKPIGVAAYRIVKQLPRELKGQLPSPAEIGRLLEGVK